MKFSYNGGSVSKEKLEEALDFLVDLEPNPDSISAEEEYEKNRKIYKESIEQARVAARKYGEQIRPQTLEAMQEVFYSITNSPKYLQSAIHTSVAYSTLNSCWDGIGPWEM